MAQPKDDHAAALSRDVMQAFDDLNGVHPGFRPAHAKGLMLSGTFTPSPQAGTLTRAPHVHRESTPVTVRFSDFAGIPSVADNDPNGASPRGIAIRFHLGEHVHTDIIGHSTDSFPVRTAEEFVEFLHAVRASGPDAAKPTPIEVFLSSHPKALEFVQAPKPFPASFATESYFAVTAFQFTNDQGQSRFGRVRIRPEGGGEYLDADTAAGKSANYLFEEMAARVAQGPVRMHIVVQIAGRGDTVDDSTAHWPQERPEMEFGTIELTALVPDTDLEKHRIIFDPIPRVDGIDPSADPLLEARADVYLLTGRRRRKAEPAVHG